ncbi:TonB-dependent siderophore receptor [Pseudidiomarina donghaiensis]|uniref:TonB-dependent siderophore receptor n=1 Tax=Pseudidiomarina donghaiensis TaxID=519452 RepID=A0A432XIQ7_9GAMM|nr:TonB-dependent siderophore receptor [Pseudidiomarina donghaiensis]RUO48477.1 TonB-dependent siderophore receptor [Pseudidiomarina donghaiensis]SFV23833.1 outer-membrane receptor for ferric coprogen and ferric-rhodotorulic acid [Pseudidiomarina donghaiensis]
MNKFSAITCVFLAAGVPVAQAAALEPQTTEAIERLQIRGEQQSGYLAGDQKSATKLDISIKETPQTVTVITQERIRDFGLTDINTALENSATINVEQVETDRTYYTSRGFELSNFQVDGLGLPLVNSNSHGRMDAALYERIEVVHGANGVMTGVGSPSATVNMVRKRPKSETKGSVVASLSSWSGKRLEGDFTGALTDSVRGRVVLVGDDRESYLDRYQNNSQLFYGVVDYAPTANTLITLGHSEHRSDSDGNMWGALTLHYGDGTPTNFDSSTNIAANWSQWNVNESRSFVDVETVLTDNWNLRFAYNRVRTDEDSYLFYTYLPDPATGLDPETGLGLLGYGSEFDFDDSQDSFDLYASGRFMAGNLEHEVVVGTNYATLNFDEMSLYDFHTGNGFPAMPALEDWNGNTPFPEFTDGLAGSDIENTQKAIYAQARFSLSLDTKLLLGGRYNEFTTEGLQYGVDQSRDEGQFIPYVGVTHNVTPSTTVYASYTETFQAQNLRDRNFERLPALTGENAEIGFKTELSNGGALLSAAYFHVKQKNLAVGDGTVTNPNTNAPEPVYRAAEGVSSQGIEVELSGELAEGLQGSIAATSFEVDGDATVEDYTPENLFRASLTYRPAALEQLKVGASFNWQDTISRVQGVVGDSYVNAGETIVTTQEAYGRLNLMASYQFTDAVSVTLNANNVLDKKYINSLLWPTQGYYGAPRNYSATVRWNF